MTEPKEKTITVQVFVSDHDFLTQMRYSWKLDHYHDVVRELIGKYKALLAEREANKP